MITQRQLFLEHLAQTSPAPILLEIERAEGVYMYDSAGKPFMDLISGISVSNLGHSHPKVLQAIKDQLDKYMHLMVYGEFVQSPQVKLASLLAKQLPPSLSSTYFTNSGSEAIEGAMKLAKRYTGRTEIISFSQAYHGSTQGALSIMGDEFFKNSFRPLLPGISILEYNNISHLSSITDKTAAVIIEPIQGEAGARPAEADFMVALKERCQETGTLLVFDEIQTGFGRTGRLFAFEHYQVIPDILVLAKGMGGGMPLGAFISSQKILSSLSREPVLGHITTFGGHPVCCAAGLACLNILLNEDLIAQVKRKEQLIRSRLVHSAIRSIRGKGLLLAVEFANADTNKAIINACIEKGLLTDWFLFADNLMRIAPPLIITEHELEKACGIILDAVGSLK